MPTYDYQCKKCGLEFEVEHSIKETPDVPCPNCGDEYGHTVRLISGRTSFSLNGGGWARDGYK